MQIVTVDISISAGFMVSAIHMGVTGMTRSSASRCFQFLVIMDKAYYSSVCSWCSLVVCLPCDGPVGTHTYINVTVYWYSFMVDFLAPVIMRSAWF